MIINFLKKVEYQIDVDEVAADIASDLDEIISNYLLNQMNKFEIDDIKDNMPAKDYERLISTIMQKALDYYCGKIAKP